jgi:hypothetical protein
MSEEKLRKRIEKLEKKLQRLENTQKPEEEEENVEISRRSFLKKLGIGALGLGALTAPVASKVTVGSNSISKDGQPYWFSGLGQSYDLSGNNLVNSGTTVYDSTNNVVPSPRTHKTVPIVVPAVNLQAGETLQVARFNNPSGKQIKIWKAVISLTDGTSDANLQLEVYNQTDGTSIYSTTSNTMQEGSPLASGGAGDEIEIRLNNNDGSAGFNAHATLIATIEQ